MPIYFLTLTDVLRIHEDQINHYGGSSGIREQNLLLSALAQASSTFSGEYLHTDIYQMAAAYVFHISGNHPFIDGNKRTTIVSTIVFLELNDIEVTAEELELENVVFSISQGKMDKPTIAAWLESNCQPLIDD